MTRRTDRTTGTWTPAAANPGPTPVGASLRRVTKSLGMPDPTTLEGVFGGWAEIVGDQVAGHVRPRSLRDGVLVVTVDQPGWATQLRYLEADLLARLAAILGDGVVTALEVRVKPG